MLFVVRLVLGLRAAAEQYFIRQLVSELDFHVEASCVRHAVSIQEDYAMISCWTLFQVHLQHGFGAWTEDPAASSVGFPNRLRTDWNGRPRGHDHADPNDPDPRVP